MTAFLLTLAGALGLVGIGFARPKTEWVPWYEKRAQAALFMLALGSVAAALTLAYLAGSGA